MKKTDLFPAALDYFTLMDGDDKSLVVRAFTPDAIVEDDGQTYRGRKEILDWLTGPAGEFTTTSTWLAVEQKDEAAEVLIRLEGNFPGGIVDLHYDFTRGAHGLISALSITT